MRAFVFSSPFCLLLMDSFPKVGMFLVLLVVFDIMLFYSQNLTPFGMFWLEELIHYKSLFIFQLGFVKIDLELKIGGVFGTAFDKFS